MPNILDATGLTLNTKTELINYLTQGMQQIYGSDADFSSNSPDGQLINLFAQPILDVYDVISELYSSFDPDNADGVVLWQRCAINGIQPKGGTYTVTNITILTSRSVNLYGLDQSANQIYTLADNAGNLWYLQDTVTGLAAGSHILSFQAATPGSITTIPNTITVQVTTVLGVVSVNNPDPAIILGINQETDAALKIRRQKSTALSSQGYLSGLIAALNNIDGMIYATVYENVEDTTDADGIPGHSIWAITSGSALPSDIAQAIYTKRNAGCGMKGEQIGAISQVNGTAFTVRWDDVILVNLFVSFTATSLNGVNPPNISGIVSGLPTSFVPGVHTEVNINALATDVQVIDPNTLVTNAGFSTAHNQIWTLSSVAASGTFKIHYNGHDSATINWNDTIITIQPILQAIPGLETATVTGSIASKVLTFDLSTIDSVQAVMYIVSNTLMTSAPAAITVAYDLGFANVLTPDTKQKQFFLEPANIIATQIVLLPMTSTTQSTLGTIQFTSQGGYGAYTYSISVNNSGGSIGSTSGLYTAGATPSVTDTVKVTDVLGNTRTATVAVT